MKFTVEFERLEEVADYVAWVRRGKERDEERARRDEVYANWKETEVGRLFWPGRIATKLQEMGIDTLDRALALTELDCLKESGFGRTTVREFMQLREKYRKEKESRKTLDEHQ